MGDEGYTHRGGGKTQVMVGVSGGDEHTGDAGG